MGVRKIIVCSRELRIKIPKGIGADARALYFSRFDCYPCFFSSAMVLKFPYYIVKLMLGDN